MRLVNSAFSEIVENRNIYLPQGITHLHLGKIFFHSPSPSSSGWKILSF